MRIIAGEAGGLKLKSYRTDRVRPTLDRVKEAIFSMIAYSIPGSRCLDLFAGFGGLGLEAVSRGAEKAFFVEKYSRNADIIRENILLCGFGERTEVIRDDVFNFLRVGNNGKYNLIFLDPPYKKRLSGRVLGLLIKNNYLTDKGMVILEHHSTETIHAPDEYRLLRNREYGDTAVKIYQVKGD